MRIEFLERRNKGRLVRLNVAKAGHANEHRAALEAVMAACADGEAA